MKPLNLLLVMLVVGAAVADESAPIDRLEITTLSTMVTDFKGVGEWGYAALIEAGDEKILFDTGGRPGLVLKNAVELGVNLAEVETVFLSHNHFDHAGGLVSLRSGLRKSNADAVSTVHAGEGIFLPRVTTQRMSMIPEELLVDIRDVRKEYEALDGQFRLHGEPHEMHPGIWITGPIPRVHPEKNWTPFTKIEMEDGLVEDTIPEDQALVLDTTKGLVIVSGCGHAGIVNTMDYAREILPGRPIYAVIGGFHLISATEEQLAWTGETMHGYGVQHVVGAHCTGLNALHHLRDSAKLDRGTAVVGAVGSRFTLKSGIAPGMIAR